jgi:hypothetical protein
VSPIAVKLRCSSAPTFPITAGPLFTPTRKRGHSGRPRRRLGGLGELERGARGSLRVVGLVDGGVEDDHHGIAGEALDHPVLGATTGRPRPSTRSASRPPPAASSAPRRP